MYQFGVKVTKRRLLSRIAPVGAAAVLAAAAGVAAIPGSATADPDAGAGQLPSFDSFLAGVADSNYSGLQSQGQAGKIDGESAFKQMRDYILDTYHGVKVEQSFMYEDNAFDCVVTATQPSVQRLGVDTPAVPPAAEPAKSTGDADKKTTEPAESPLTLGLSDKFGNEVSCGKGSIPMQRITLERMSRFATLADFLAKGPGEVGKRTETLLQQGHKYAHAYQTVNNLGGESIINLWNPDAGFSLSQHWYTAGTGAGLQTVEGGWVKYPDKFGDRSVLFIYYTPDNYSTGCYNLDCSAFVQTNSDWALGAGFTQYSTIGGDQRVFVQQWQLSGGNWWLFLGTSESDLVAVGYYPASAYNNGPVTTGAVDIDYGGETADAGGYGQMGSGRFASEGWQYAAYQSRIFYIGTDGATYWGALTPDADTPACYTIDYHDNTGTNGATYFYHGGPGGAC